MEREKEILKSLYKNRYMTLEDELFLYENNLIEYKIGKDEKSGITYLDSHIVGDDALCYNVLFENMKISRKGIHRQIDWRETRNLREDEKRKLTDEGKKDLTPENKQELDKIISYKDDTKLMELFVPDNHIYQKVAVAKVNYFVKYITENLKNCLKYIKRAHFDKLLYPIDRKEIGINECLLKHLVDKNKPGVTDELIKDLIKTFIDDKNDNKVQEGKHFHITPYIKKNKKFNKDGSVAKVFSDTMVIKFPEFKKHKCQFYQVDPIEKTMLQIDPGVFDNQITKYRIIQKIITRSSRIYISTQGYFGIRNEARYMAIERKLNNPMIDIYNNLGYIYKPLLTERKRKREEQDQQPITSYNTICYYPFPEIVPIPIPKIVLKIIENKRKKRKIVK